MTLQIERLQSTLQQLEKANDQLKAQKAEAEAAYARRTHELTHENRQLRLRLQQCGLEVREIRAEEARMRAKRTEADQLLQDALAEALRDKEAAEREVARLTAFVQDLKTKNVEAERALKDISANARFESDTRGGGQTATQGSLRHLEDLNSRTRKLQEENHQLRLELQTHKVMLRDQETALRHEASEQLYQVKAQQKQELEKLYEERDQQLLKFQKEHNDESLSRQRERSNEIAKIEDEKRQLVQKLEQASDEVYNARQQYNGELSLLRRALQCQQKEHQKAVSVMSGMCTQIDLVESQYRQIAEDKNQADRELMTKLDATQTELQRYKARFADQERWTAYLNNVIETVEHERDDLGKELKRSEDDVEKLTKAVTVATAERDEMKRQNESKDHDLQQALRDTDIKLAEREKTVLLDRKRIEQQKQEQMEKQIQSMEAHIQTAEQQLTRLADSRDWLESEKIIMEQDLMAEIHRLEQEVRRTQEGSLGALGAGFGTGVGRGKGLAT